MANTVYKNLSLLYSVVSGQDTALYQMVIHMIMAAASATVSLWYYVLYIQYPGTYAAFAGMTLKATVTGSKCIQLVPLVHLFPDKLVFNVHI